MIYKAPMSIKNHYIHLAV